MIVHDHTYTHTHTHSHCPHPRYFWPLTFDEATYSLARKIIYFVKVAAPASGKFDSMNLPDFGIFVLSVEWWHTAYTLLKHSAFGPAVPKGADEDDNKRFTYKNFTQPMLVIQRKRGIIDDELTEALETMGVTIQDNDKALSINKEKMSAEFRDMHLYLTYLRIAFLKFKNEFPDEYDRACDARSTDLDLGCAADTVTGEDESKDESDSEDGGDDEGSGGGNLDVNAILNFLESRLPCILDFTEHLHFSNVEVGTTTYTHQHITHIQHLLTHTSYTSPCRFWNTYLQGWQLFLNKRAEQVTAAV